MRQGEIEVGLREAQGARPSGRFARILAGRYRLDALIGSGGAADVHRGFDLRLRRPVAVKIFRAGTGFDTEEDFRSEAVILARLQHPGLVTAYDAGRHDGEAFLVMQLVDGPTLKARLAQSPLSSEATAALGSELADALAHAHEEGIIHRDVKPSNILLDASGRPHLTDFGISRRLDATTRTATGTLVGTAAYLSPEQVLGRPVGRPADVYALGLVLLECLTGRLEYDGTPLEAAIARVHRPPALPDFLPAELATLLRQMTALDEETRPTAHDCARTLAQLAAVTHTAERTACPAVSSVVPAAAEYGDAGGTHHGLLPDAKPHGLSWAALRPAFARSRLGMCGSAAALAAVVTAGLVVTDGFSQHSATGEAAPSASSPAVPSSPGTPTGDDHSPATPTRSSTPSSSAQPIRDVAPGGGAHSSSDSGPDRHPSDRAASASGKGTPADATARGKKKSPTDLLGRAKGGKGKKDNSAHEDR
ncbi:serine/threonine-protein kinase [Streptomyces sp. NPDC002144]